MEVKITTELLVWGMLVFAVMDAVYAPLLVWRIRAETFRRLRWPLAAAAALIWWGIWRWAIGYYWETVYIYVLPPWAQTWWPWMAFIVAGAVAVGLWAFSLRIRARPVLFFLFLGGSLGSLTHLWAVYRGIVTKPPILQGASPLAAVVFAFFEFLLYWCVILTLAAVFDWVGRKFIEQTNS